jgi:hypothetical protein
MKKYIITLFTLFTLLTSCEKLDQVPEDTANIEAIFGNEKGLELYANSFYDVLPTASAIHQSDAMSDYGARTQVPDFLLPGAFGPRQSSGWDWDRLRNINYFIENCRNPKVSETIRRNYLGLARFFRAWFYFDKVKRFGDVPWINKTMDVNDPSLFNGRDSRIMVIDSVLADLDYACQNITNANDNSRSLISKNAAYAFKSRVCLFEGTYRKYHKELNSTETANKLLSDAVSAAEKVMTGGGYSLYTGAGTDKSYRQLFTSTMPVTSEIILSVVMDANLSVFNDANWWWTSATYGSRVSFTREFVNTYLSIDGTPFTSKPGYETMTFAQEVKNRDKRLQQTIRMGDYKRINGGATEPAPPVFSYTYTGYQPIKWTLDDVYYDGGSRNINSICLIRYAEVLLNYAEAKAELGTFTSSDWSKTIGALRTRAGIANANILPTVADTYFQQIYFPDITDPVLLEIRRERSIELVLEGFRFYDIVRWKRGALMERIWNGFYVPALNQPLDLNEDGILDVCFYKEKPAVLITGVTYVNVAETISGGVNPQRLSHDTYGELTWLNNVTRKWEDKHYLYPIPESDRLLNPKLGQNPGW